MDGVIGGSGALQPSGVHPIPLMLGVLGLVVGVVNASTYVDPVVVDSLIITPAFAHALEMVW